MDWHPFLQAPPTLLFRYNRLNVRPTYLMDTPARLIPDLERLQFAKVDLRALRRFCEFSSEEQKDAAQPSYPLIPDRLCRQICLIVERSPLLLVQDDHLIFLG